MFDWDVSVFGNFDKATWYKVVDRFDRKVEGIQEAKQIPLLGVFVRRLVKDADGHWLVVDDAFGRPHIASKLEMIWFGELKKRE